MEPIELRDIGYIMAVYSEKSFSRAAEKCYISQPALSRVVHKAEERLGIPLFDRSVQPLRATPDGEVVIGQLRKMQEIETQIEEYCEARKWADNHELTIAASSFFCTYILPPVINNYEEEHPGSRILLLETNDTDLPELLHAGQANIGISVNTQLAKKLDSTVLMDEMIVLAVPSDLPVNKQLKAYRLKIEDMVSGRIRSPEVYGVSMREFKEEKFVLMRQGHDMYRRCMEIFTDAGFRPKIQLEMDQLLSAYYMALAGRGIAFTRSSVPYYAGYTDRLCFYKIDHPKTVRQIYLLRDHNSRPEKNEESFLSYLREHKVPG